MQKIIDIALKDMTQSFRSLFAVMFMFVVPILMTGMFYLMMGGSSEEEQGFNIPVTKVILVNLDEGEFLEGASTPGNPNSIGESLGMILQSEDFDEFMDVTVVQDQSQAVEMVDNQEAGVAVIIPNETTSNYMDPQKSTTIEFYQDPTLTIGPAIIKGIIANILDGFSGSKITLGITLSQLESAMIPVDEKVIQAVMGQYFEEIQSNNPTSLNNPTTGGIKIISPTPAEKTDNQAANVTSLIMTGMTVFYVFFTGASGAQTILREEVKGTLPRLFTTPTSGAIIVTGKFLAVFLTIVVQLTVLVLFGNLVFGIQWGGLVQVILLSLSITITAAGFGSFLISWVRTERQAGTMIGGLVTIMGMMGMMPIFVIGTKNPPPFVNLISHLVPQGWAVEGLQRAMAGGTINEVMPNVVVLIVWSVFFIIVGIARFKKRFA
jgi:ABC-2 type transport system permease protein